MSDSTGNGWQSRGLCHQGDPRSRKSKCAPWISRELPGKNHLDRNLTWCSVSSQHAPTRPSTHPAYPHVSVNWKRLLLPETAAVTVVHPGPSRRPAFTDWASQSWPQILFPRGGCAAWRILSNRRDWLTL